MQKRMAEPQDVQGAHGPSDCARPRDARPPRSEPRRCDTGLVGSEGECVACNADQGAQCRAPLQPTCPIG